MDNQVSLRDDIESVLDDFSSLSESLHLLKDLMTNNDKCIGGEKKIKHYTLFIVTMFLRTRMN